MEFWGVEVRHLVHLEAAEARELLPFEVAGSLEAAGAFDGFPGRQFGEVIL